MDGYRVAIKASARRTNGAVGSLICRQGERHRFETRAAAVSWAETLSTDGGSRVWIRDANPNDSMEIDGYLMSVRTRRERGESASHQSRIDAGLE